MADVVEVILRVRSDQAKTEVGALGREAAAATTGVEQLEQQLDELGDGAQAAAADVGDLNTGLQDTGASSSVSAGDVAAFGAAMVAAGAILKGVIDDLVEIARASFEASNQLGDLSARSEVSTLTLAGFRLAAKGSGQDLSEFAEGLGQLPRRLADAAAGVGEASAGFSRLGIAVTDLDGNLRSTDEILREVAVAATEPGVPLDALSRALGEAFGPKLVQALSGAENGLEDFIAAADALGTAQAVDFTAEMQRGFGLIEEAVLGAGASILNVLGADGGVAGVFDLLLRGIEFTRAAFEELIVRIRAFVGALSNVAEQGRATFSILVDLFGGVAEATADAGNGIFGFFGSLIGNFGTLVTGLANLLREGLETVLGVALQVASALGLDAQVAKIDAALNGLSTQIGENVDAIGELAQASRDLLDIEGGIISAGAGAAAGLDTSAALATLVLGDAGASDAFNSAAADAAEDLFDVEAWQAERDQQIDAMIRELEAENRERERLRRERERAERQELRDAERRRRDLAAAAKRYEEAIRNAAQGALDLQLAAVSGNVGALTSQAGVVGQVLGAVSSIGEGGAAGVETRLTEFSENFRNGIRALPEIIGSVLPSFIEDTVSQGPKIIAEVLPSLIRSAGTFIREALPAFFGSDGLLAVVDAFSDPQVWADLIDAIALAIPDVLIGLIDAFILNIPRAIGAILEVFADPAFWVALKDAIVEAGKGLAREIVDTFREAYPALDTVASGGGGGRGNNRIFGGLQRGGEGVLARFDAATGAGFANFAQGRAPTVIMNGVIAEDRTRLGEYLERLLSGDRRFGFAV